MTTKEKYIDYCAKHAMPLFFKPFWLNIFETEWDVLFEKEKDDFVFFVYSLEKKFKFKIIRNNFLTPYSGFLFSNKKTSDTIKQKLIHQVVSHLPASHELHIDLHPSIGTGFDFNHLKTENKRTNILDISDFDVTFSNYKPSLKRQIKKATKNISIQETDDIKLFYALHEKTFSKQNKKAITPFTAFEKTWKICRKNNCGKLLFAIDESGNIHAALFLVYDEESAYYLAGGTDNAFYGSGAMSYLMNESIKKSSEAGKKYFDFEGSMLPGVNRFFTNFSPEEKQYNTISKMDSAILKLIKQIKK